MRGRTVVVDHVVFIHGIQKKPWILMGFQKRQHVVKDDRRGIEYCASDEKCVLVDCVDIPMFEFVVIDVLHNLMVVIGMSETIRLGRKESMFSLQERFYRLRQKKISQI